MKDQRAVTRLASVVLAPNRAGLQLTSEQPNDDENSDENVGHASTIAIFIRRHINPRVEAGWRVERATVDLG